MSFQSGNGPGLVRALALSLFLHILLLWPSLPSWPVANVVQPLVATLRAPVGAAAVTPPMPAKTPMVERSAKSPAGAATATPNLIEQPEMPIGSTTESPARSEQPARAAAAQAAPAPAMAASPPAEGLDAEGLRGYRIALSREMKRFKRYPRQASEAGWGGTAEVRVVVAAGGIAQEAQLARSSGHPVLDQAALDMLQRALPLAPVPAVLRTRAFAVDLPVVFEPPAD